MVLFKEKRIIGIILIIAIIGIALGYKFLYRGQPNEEIIKNENNNEINILQEDATKNDTINNINTIEKVENNIVSEDSKIESEKKNNVTANKANKNNTKEDKNTSKEDNTKEQVNKETEKVKEEKEETTTSENKVTTNQTSNNDVKEEVETNTNEEKNEEKIDTNIDNETKEEIIDTKEQEEEQEPAEENVEKYIINTEVIQKMKKIIMDNPSEYMTKYGYTIIDNDSTITEKTNQFTFSELNVKSKIKTRFGTIKIYARDYYCNNEYVSTQCFIY